jgi:formate/nitrite transporter FocA (FNT family)
MRRGSAEATGKAYDCSVSQHDKPLSALPSRAARATAFVAILTAGLFGGFIGYMTIKVQCDGDCHTQKGLGIFIGSIAFAVGMSVVAVLGLRAVGEWREAQDSFDA